MSMTPDFQSFAAQERSQGFDEVLVREWEPTTPPPSTATPSMSRRWWFKANFG